MANALLDFVISLLRDPNTAARYAADPAQALADAGLEDVTSADVQNLIPVVVESLSMTAPSYGPVEFGAGPTGNVWASGAATAAFDAFDDRVPASGFGVVSGSEIHGDILDAIPGDMSDDVPDHLRDHLESLQLDEPVAESFSPAQDHVATGTRIADDWFSPATDPEPGDPNPGFDIFD